MVLPVLPRRYSAGDLLRLWPLEAGAYSVRDRVERLVSGVWGSEIEADSLGLRNQRALVLHQEIVAKPIDARVVCPTCDTANEVALPIAELLSAPSPDAEEKVHISRGGQNLQFRIPRLADLGATDTAQDLAARLCTTQGRHRFTETDLEQLAAAWEIADPAGVVELCLVCEKCERHLNAISDPQVFVAHDLDVAVDRFMREVDLIARAYGWSERQIVALPQARRQRYVSMISTAVPPRLHAMRSRG